MGRDDAIILDVEKEQNKNIMWNSKIIQKKKKKKKVDPQPPPCLISIFKLSTKSMDQKTQLLSKLNALTAQLEQQRVLKHQQQQQANSQKFIQQSNPNPRQCVYFAQGRCINKFCNYSHAQGIASS
jgi:hypothetical protein